MSRQRRPVAYRSRQRLCFKGLPKTIAALVLILPGMGRSEEPPKSPASFATVPVLPDERLGVRTAPLWLLSRPDVRADVQLDPKQTAEAERVLAGLFAKAAAIRGKSGPEIVNGRRAIDDAEQEWLQTRLGEAQRKRLIEIDLQWEGPSALISRPVVADHLGLTPEQRAALKQAVAECQRLRASGSHLRDSEHQLGQQALRVLTPEQSQRWKVMLGHPFTPRLTATH